jgi:L-rhamnose mutarotase
MNSTLLKVVIVGLLLSLAACQNNVEPPSTDQTPEPIQQMVFMAELKDDSTSIAQYEYYHRDENLWPEINQAARAAGFERITISRFGNRLVMIQEFKKGLDKKRMDSLYVAYSPRLKEWGKLMATLQQAPPGAPANQTWVEMLPVYSYPSQINQSGK